MQHDRRFTRGGFTLNELLVVMGIIGMLMALLLPAIQATRESARNIGCLNNCRQLAIASLHVHDSHSAFPSSVFDFRPDRDPRYSSDRGWAVDLLSALDQSRLADKYDKEEAAFSRQNEFLANTKLAVSSCPSGSGSGILLDLSRKFGSLSGGAEAVIGDYVGNHGTAAFDGSLSGKGVVLVLISGQRDEPTRIRDVFDGTSHTLLLWESVRGQYYRESATGLVSADWREWQTLCRPWLNYHGSGELPIPATNPADIGYLVAWTGANTGVVSRKDCATGWPYRVNFTNGSNAPFSFHPGGANAAFADGSCKQVNQNVAGEILYALASRSGGENFEFP